MDTPQEKIMGWIGTGLFYFACFGGIFTVGILVWRDAPISEFFNILLPFFIAIMLLSYMGRYHTLHKEHEELKRQLAEKKPDDPRDLP